MHSAGELQGEVQRAVLRGQLPFGSAQGDRVIRSLDKRPRRGRHE